MIRLRRTDPPGELASKLDARTRRLGSAGADTARRRWKSARDLRALLREELSRFAAGLDRCMYCGDNVGTDVDHVEPITRAPGRTFDWLNHLLACSRCNSQAKGFAFPLDQHGVPLLIDPTAEDPYDHLELRLSVGRYIHLTEKGRVTIELLRLNRAELERGRAFAFVRTSSMLRDVSHLVEGGRADLAKTVMEALRGQPFVDVLHAMLRLRGLPGAQAVLGGPEVLRALELLAAHDK
ncbi:HNH endonuclease [Nocardiopsis synnemataformans]|uniref:HNH endonuclease n=1 Tax=Nocardiopsis synnemataformans TaxID=61305 RepID=UPI003EC146E7